MFRKKGPLALVLLLLFFLVFVIGVRYGQEVVMTNKKIDFILKLSPTFKPSPVPQGYTTYTLTACGITFIYPLGLSLEKESSVSALFLRETKKALEVDCSPESALKSILADEKVASAEVSFQGRETAGKQNQERYFFSFRNVKNTRTVYVGIEKNLLPLFDGSLKF